MRRHTRKQDTQTNHAWEYFKHVWAVFQTCLGSIPKQAQEVAAKEAGCIHSPEEVATLGQPALEQHGFLVVRGLVTSRMVKRGVAAIIDRVKEALGGHGVIVNVARQQGIGFKPNSHQDNLNAMSCNHLPIYSLLYQAMRLPTCPSAHP